MREQIKITALIALLLLCKLSQGQFVYFDTLIDYNGYTERLNNVTYSDSNEFLFVRRSTDPDSFSGHLTLFTMNSIGELVDSVKYTPANAEHSFGTIVNMPGNSGYVFFGSELIYHDSISYIDADVLLIRYNQDESIRWAKRYGAFNRYDICQHGFLTSDGGFVAVAQSSDSLQSTADNLLVKIDSAGNEEWKRYYGGNHYEAALSGLQTPDQGFLVLGWTRSYGAGQRDWYLIKADSIGNQQWQKTYGDGNSQSGWTIINLQDGNYLMTGGAGNSHARMIKIDTSGNVIWQKNYHVVDSESNYLFDAVELPNGDIVAIGGTDNMIDGNDGWLIKANSSGSLIWHRKYFKSYHTDLFYGVLHTNDNGFLLSGQARNHDTPSLNQDAWILKVDSMGCRHSNCLIVINGIDTPEIIADVYPNPASHTLNIEWQNQAKAKLKFFNQIGGLVLSKTSSSQRETLDMSHLRNGLYFLHIIQGDAKAVVKVVVQR